MSEWTEAYKAWVIKTFNKETWDWRHEALPRVFENAFKAGWEARDGSTTTTTTVP